MISTREAMVPCPLKRSTYLLHRHRSRSSGVSEKNWREESYRNAAYYVGLKRLKAWKRHGRGMEEAWRREGGGTGAARLCHIFCLFTLPNAVFRPAQWLAKLSFAEKLAAELSGNLVVIIFWGGTSELDPGKGSRYVYTPLPYEWDPCLLNRLLFLVSSFPNIYICSCPIFSSPSCFLFFRSFHSFIHLSGWFRYPLIHPNIHLSAYLFAYLLNQIRQFACNSDQMFWRTPIHLLGALSAVCNALLVENSSILFNETSPDGHPLNKRWVIDYVFRADSRNPEQIQEAGGFWAKGYSISTAPKQISVFTTTLSELTLISAMTRTAMFRRLRRARLPRAGSSNA